MLFVTVLTPPRAACRHRAPRPPCQQRHLRRRDEIVPSTRMHEPHAARHARWGRTLVSHGPVWWTRLDGDRDQDRRAALPACQVSMLASASWIQTLGIPGAAVTLKGMRSSPRLSFARRQLLSVRTENIPVPPSACFGRAGEPRAALARGSRSPARMLAAAAETLSVAGTGGHGRVPGAPRCQPRGAAGRRFGPAQRLSKWQERSTAQTQECLFLFPIEFLFISCPYGYLFSPPLTLWQGSRILMRRKLVKSQAFPGGRFGNERLV